MSTRFSIKKVDGDLYIHSDIDSSGMSVVLSNIRHADTWDNDDEAAAFMRRVVERYPTTKLEVVAHVHV